jgi:hypothetical protein
MFKIPRGNNISRRNMLAIVEAFLLQYAKINKLPGKPYRIFILSLLFIPASNEPSGCLQTFGDCREGQIPRCSAALQV